MGHVLVCVMLVVHSEMLQVLQRFFEAPLRRRFDESNAGLMRD